MLMRMRKCYSLSCRDLTLLTVLAVAIQLIGLSLFIVGFFPVKPSFSGMSGLESFYPPGFDSTHRTKNRSALPPEKLKNLYQGLCGVHPLFDRLIIMIIDGLPAEFVLGKDQKPPIKAFAEAMPYTQSLLAKGLAIGYHAKAASPTVTMPRLKALVSGAIGGFLDIVFNFNTQAFLHDNLIVQFHRIGWKMVMHGDETWIKMFPNMFDRHDGVSSFFVKDIIEVDYNVSRHLTYELDMKDWDLLILHYLGVDHVGHIGGRDSILMGPKLKEMDEVIKVIHSSITRTEDHSQRQTLLLVASDHGMTGSGNHGGSSFEETDSLALFVSGKKFNNAEKSLEAYQVDIASTLALLFGVPIPQNNVGTAMTEVFSSLEDDQLLRILELNSFQLLRVLQTHFTGLRCERYACNSGSSRNSDAERLCCLYLASITLHKSCLSKSSQSNRSVTEDDHRSIVRAYRNFLSTASRWLSSRSSDKSIGLLALGLTAMGLSCLGLMRLIFLFAQEVNFMKKRLSDADKDMHTWCLDEYFTVGIIFILILSMGSSSMIEEEQYIWHFMTTSLYLVFFRRVIQSTECNASNLTRVIAVLIIGRILRGWHQGGVNWSYLPDISKLLKQAGTEYIKSVHLLSLVLVVICFGVILKVRMKMKMRSAMLMLVYIIPAMMILKHILKHQDEIFTSLSEETTTVIQVIYALIGLSTVGMLVAVPWLMPVHNPTSLRNVFNLSTAVVQEKVVEAVFRSSIFVIGWCNMFSWCLFQMLLQKQINSLPACLLLVQILFSIHCFGEGGLYLKEWVKVAALYYLGMAGHFALGNTNTLSTIDVAGAFTGISSHSTFTSGVLMFVITYASPMLSLLSMPMCVSMVEKGAYGYLPDDIDFTHLLKSTLGYPCLVPLVLNSILLFAYTIVLLLMRNHLFVWSVFSPKYMYVCASTACTCIGVSIMAVNSSYSCMVFSRRRKLTTV